MKKLFAALLIAALPLTACNPTKTTARHTEKQTVYHLPDGRYAYQDDGIWYYMMMTQGMNRQPVYVTGSPSSTSGWSAGAAPSTTQLAGAQTESTDVVTNDNGQPVTPAEAVEAVGTAESYAGPSDSSPLVSEGVVAEDTSSSVDTSSSMDSGGSSDAGGGGGGDF